MGSITSLYFLVAEFCLFLLTPQDRKHHRGMAALLTHATQETMPTLKCFGWQDRTVAMLASTSDCMAWAAA